jgi:hypothetical protein
MSATELIEDPLSRKPTPYVREETLEKACRTLRVDTVPVSATLSQVAVDRLDNEITVEGRRWNRSWTMERELWKANLLVMRLPEINRRLKAIEERNRMIEECSRANKHDLSEIKEMLSMQ